jgi:hypothetical protein
MGTVYNDLDKQLLAAFSATNTAYRANLNTPDEKVIREMAEIWVDSGGDSMGLMDGYLNKLLAEIDRLGGE